MRSSISKKIVAGLAALAMTAAFSLTTTPADAQFRHGGFGGGFGGWHGGGFGGWRGAGWGGGWRGGGWGWGGGWRGCGWGGCGYGGFWPGLAAGALIGTAATYPYWGGYSGYGYPYYGAAYASGYDQGCRVYRRTYNRHGHYIGRRLVNVCM